MQAAQSTTMGHRESPNPCPGKTTSGNPKLGGIALSFVRRCSFDLQDPSRAAQFARAKEFPFTMQ